MFSWLKFIQYNSAAGMLRRAGLDPQPINERRAPEGPSHPNDIEGYAFKELPYISTTLLTYIFLDLLSLDLQSK